MKRDLKMNISLNTNPVESSTKPYTNRDLSEIAVIYPQWNPVESTLLKNRIQDIIVRLNQSIYHQQPNQLTVPTKKSTNYTPLEQPSCVDIPWPKWDVGTSHVFVSCFDTMTTIIDHG